MIKIRDVKKTIFKFFLFAVFFDLKDSFAEKLILNTQLNPPNWQLLLEQYQSTHEREKLNIILHALDHYSPQTALAVLTRTCGPNIPTEVVIGAQQLLQQDIYRYTNQINDRYILDYPQFFFLFCDPYRWKPYINFFYNQTSLAYYTSDGTTLSSYLAFDNQNLITKIDQLTFGFNIVQLFSLLGNVKIEDRRGGFMFGGQGFKGRWYFEGKVPLIYVERNFHLTPEEKRALENETFFNDEDELHPELHDFTRKHLISDKWGIGDTRLNVGYTFIDGSVMKLIGGLEATLPTALPLGKGLYGSHFEKNNVNPRIDLVLLFNLAAAGNTLKLQENIINFLLGALDKLSSNLLEAPLGNNGHVGLGFFLYNELTVTQKLTFLTRSSLEYLLPSPEKIFYILKKDPEEFARFNTSTPEKCLQDIAFLEQQLVNTLFPSIFNTIVFPGFIFKFSACLSGQMTERWQIMLGYDLWWQQRQGFGKIFSHEIARDKLKVDIARRPVAFQNKVFGSAIYNKSGAKYDWCLSAYADKTFLSSGIGKDFTIGLRLELLF